MMPGRSETLRPGLACDWYADGRIIAYRLTQVSAAIISDWAAYARQTVESWPTDRPYLALHDVAHEGISLQYAALVEYDLLNIGITQTGRAVIENWVAQRPAFTARVVVNLNFTVSERVSKALMFQQIKANPAIQYRAYFNRARSLEWLLQALEAPRS